MLDRGDKREEVGWDICAEFICSAVEEDERGKSWGARGSRGQFVNLDGGQIATSIAPSIPVFWGHGTIDAQVHHDKAFAAASTLAQVLNVPIRHNVSIGETAQLSPKDPGIRFNSYEGLPHWIDPEDELSDLVMWIRGVIPTIEAK